MTDNLGGVDTDTGASDTQIYWRSGPFRDSGHWSPPPPSPGSPQLGPLPAARPERTFTDGGWKGTEGKFASSEVRILYFCFSLVLELIYIQWEKEEKNNKENAEKRAKGTTLMSSKSCQSEKNSVHT